MVISVAKIGATDRFIRVNLPVTVSSAELGQVSLLELDNFASSSRQSANSSMSDTSWLWGRSASSSSWNRSRKRSVVE